MNLFKREQRHRLSLEGILLIVLLLSAMLAGAILTFLKRQHDQQAHLAATATLLEEGIALLDTMRDLGLACSTNSTPQLWRELSTSADHVFAVRKDLQSLSLSRDGVAIFHRQADSPHHATTPSAAHKSSPRSAAIETDLSTGTLEISGTRYPVFVISQSTTLPDGSTMLSEATLRRDASGAEEATARTLVSSLYNLAMVVLTLSFFACAVVLLLAITRDRKRHLRSRQEEHLAFSGVLANGILHDFRNPMSAVRLDAQMLGREMQREDGFRSERVTTLAERIARAMERMDKVFQEFLYLARPAEERLENIPLENVIRECSDTITPRLEQASLTLEIEGNLTGVQVVAHPFALRRALLNVLMNATQFAPPNTAIRITVATTPRQALITISDSGPGIPPEMRRKIFDIFVTGRPEGTGLGLFLARTAIQRCGGEITALPLKEATGSAIRITLALEGERPREPSCLQSTHYREGGTSVSAPQHPATRAMQNLNTEH